MSPECGSSGVRGQGLFSGAGRLVPRPGGRPDGSCTPHRPPRHHWPPRYHRSQTPARCRAGVTTTMEHCRGHNHHDAPSSWFSGPAWQAPERDQVHHGHHPPRDPDAHLGRAAPMSPGAPMISPAPSWSPRCSRRTRSAGSGWRTISRLSARSRAGTVPAGGHGRTETGIAGPGIAWARDRGRGHGRRRGR
jgi:hypothetical protein